MLYCCSSISSAVREVALAQHLHCGGGVGGEGLRREVQRGHGGQEQGAQGEQQLRGGIPVLPGGPPRLGPRLLSSILNSRGSASPARLLRQAALLRQALWQNRNTYARAGRPRLKKPALGVRTRAGLMLAKVLSSCSKNVKSASS